MLSQGRQLRLPHAPVANAGMQQHQRETRARQVVMDFGAVYQRLTNLPSAPRILGPEVVGLGFNDVQHYTATMNGSSFYGVAHHLYGGSTDGTPAGYVPAMNALTNVFPAKPRFMTEYGVNNMIDAASLIHYVLTAEQASGYNFWSLVWPAGGVGLVQIENPYDRSSWTNAPAGTTGDLHGWWLSPCYWSMKHFSYFIQPGYKHVAMTCNDTNVLASAYLSPDGLRLVAVLINKSASASSTLTPNFGSFSYFNSSVYQTGDTNYYFLPLGTVGSQLTMPPSSLTTVVLDKFVAVGAASNPTPTNSETGVALNTSLNWSAGNNSVSHALYLGLDSNAVATATTASPEYQGLLSTNSFTPTALAGNATYYWRVDEIIGANVATGAAWSFITVPAPALGHRYTFSETGGNITADSIGGPPWAGTLPNGGAFSSGQLTLASASQQFVLLPGSIMSTLSNFTIEAWVKLNSTANRNRIFDFGNDTTTYMFLTPQNGSSTKLRFAITTGGGGGEQQINGPSALSVGVWYHLAVTLNGNTGILYANGTAIATNNAMTLTPAILGNTSNNYLGRSQFSADPYFNGAIDEFRIYNVALSPAEIAATDALGPNQALSTASPILNMATTPGNLTITWPLASAGFTPQLSTNLVLGGWTNVPSPSPQIIGGQWQLTLPSTGNSDSIFYRLAK